MDDLTKELLDKVLKAHGIENASKFQNVKINTHIGGAVWGIKGYDKALEDVVFEASLTEQRSTWTNIFSRGYTSSFEPGKVELFDENGSLLENLENPRASFKGHTVETSWTRSQLIYFSSYATWNYTTAPFNFLVPGTEIKKLESWDENGETLERLEVIYPEGFATHSKRQVFYFGVDGLLKRHDYWPDVLGGSSATQVIEDYKEFDGIRTGTKRRIYVLNDEDNTYSKDFVLVSIDILDVQFK
ncbi:hypothetical protein QFZ37_002005 [Chryseobacterium ginsenosidimutans]|uniref:hypothetical protein n=1 Tax=Chryseobacterium ginsenosidimutans TaxID=687846 RepID=UPI0027832BCF|nr:hypothetical protein [Chryseobacterium ginsenosidimutans]MDQ0593636.1 hypothetical protein [Chryseobacterium ginsenosidimutans]